METARLPLPDIGAPVPHLTGTLRRLRKWSGLTLDGLRELDSTLPRSTVSAIERGERRLAWPFIASFVTACLDSRGVPPRVVREQLARWREAFDTVRIAEVPFPRGPSTTPRDIAGFIGREEEIRQLVAHVLESGSAPTIVALHGMPGVGKTALAVRLAHLLAPRYPDGQLFVDLRARVEPIEALRRLLRMLGVTPQIPLTDTEEWAEVWRAELCRRRLLVVLDDVAGSDQVELLLPGRSASLVLITSRSRPAGLHAGGVLTLDVDVLLPTEAAALFSSAAGVNARTPEVDQIVARCGWLPLALRLAASRLALRPTWTIGDLATRLSQPLDVLRVENLSVQTAFDETYRRLTENEAQAFRVLGLLPAGEFGLDVFAAQLDMDAATADTVLDQLVAHSLVREVGKHRYRTHPLTHEYARKHA